MPGSSVFKYTGVHKCAAPKRPRYADVSYGFINLYVSHPTHVWNQNTPY